MHNNIDENLFRQAKIDFAAHMTIPSNDRIIFSGRFGIGKSTFINYFLGKGDKYNYIHLYPVNYSIATNEDIFKYIKYDIILEMISKDYPIEHLDFTKWQSLPGFLSKNIHKIATTLLYAVPVLGKNLVDLAEKITKLATDFTEQHKQNNKQGNEKTILETYLTTIENLDGGLYEWRLENEVIENVLRKKKESEPKKPTVLIIDDLDRIDPDHIFRILNVFAAHFDYHSSSRNKFGFDKVILVCDIENIRSIFHHKYGMEVDFNGYIDKFYSHEVFQFSNRKTIVRFVKQALGKIEWLSEYFSPGEIEGRRTAILQDDKFLVLFVTELCHLGLLNLRNVVKWKDKPFYFVEFVDFEEKQLNIDSHPCLLIMKFLTTFLGSKSSLIATIGKIPVSQFVFRKRVMENFCYQLMAVFTRQNEDPYNTEMNFSYDSKEYSGIYEGSESMHDLKVNLLVPTMQNSEPKQTVPVDAVILKICMLKYLEHI